MKEFLTQNFEWILAAAALMLFAVQVIRIVRKAKRIDREGLVADAVVSRIEEVRDPEIASSSYVSYVKFTDRDGVTRECPMALTPNIEYDIGQRLRIKYSPGDYKMVREAKD